MTEITVTSNYLRWEKALANGACRYYEVRVQNDLWGDVILTRIWGRRGTPRGRVTHTPVPERDTAPLIDAIARRRRQHDYLLVTLPMDHRKGLL